MNEIEKLTKEFCYLNGIDTSPIISKEWLDPEWGVWTSIDPEDGTGPRNRMTPRKLPDFADAREVIDVMLKRDDFDNWWDYLVKHTPLVDLFMDKTGFMLKEAIRWITCYTKTF